MFHVFWILGSLLLCTLIPSIAQASAYDMVSHLLNPDAATHQSALMGFFSAISHLLVNTLLEPLEALASYLPGPTTGLSYFIIIYTALLALFRGIMVYHLRKKGSVSLTFLFLYLVLLISLSVIFLHAANVYFKTGDLLTSLQIFIFLTLTMASYRVLLFTISPLKKITHQKSSSLAYSYFKEMPKSKRMIIFQVYFVRVVYSVGFVISLIALIINTPLWATLLHAWIHTIFILYIVVFSLYLISLWQAKVWRAIVFILSLTLAIVSYITWVRHLFWGDDRDLAYGGLTLLFLIFPFLLLPFFKRVGRAVHKRLPRAKVSKKEERGYYYLDKLLPTTHFVKWMLFIIVWLPLLHFILYFQKHSHILSWLNNLISSIFENTILIVIFIIVGLGFHGYLIKRKKALKPDAPYDIYHSPKQHRLLATLNIITRLYPFIFLIILLFLLFYIFGLNMAYLTTFLGLVAAALIFVGKKFIMDLFKGILYAFQGLIQEGLYIEVKGSNYGTITGTVCKMYIQCVSLKMADGQIMTVEYGNIKSIKHFTDAYTYLQFTLPSATPMETVLKLIEKIKQSFNKAHPQNPLYDLELIEINDENKTNLLLTVRVKTDPLKQWAIRPQLKASLLTHAKDHKVLLSFPEDAPPPSAK